MLEKFTNALDTLLFTALWCAMGSLMFIIFAVVYKAVYM